MSFLVFDIETVPDPALWTAPATSPPTDIAPKRKPRAKKDEFPPHFAHRPVAIGYVLLNEELDVVNMGVAGTTTFGEDERALLVAWNAFADQNRATLVSFNGRSFDMPVLSLRALRHGVAQGWYGGGFRNRYKDDHLDLFDQLTEYGLVGRAGFSLDQFSQIIGLPGKGGMDGSKVAGMFAAGQAQKIESYCLVDVARTTFLFFRYQLMRGRITLDHYRTVATRFMHACSTAGLDGGISFGSDTKRLFLEE
jgi:predicted PolB exonuclease-like 3'-5' exonuclease